MGNPAPVAPAALLDDPRVVLTNIGIEQDGGTDAIFVQQLHDPPDADPAAIVPPTLVQRVGVTSRRLVQDADGGLSGFIVLYIKADIDSQPLAPRPLDVRPVDDRPVLVEVVLSHMRLTQQFLYPGNSDRESTKNRTFAPIMVDASRH